MKIVISTEVWNTKTGQIIKAVARDGAGRILGATNQTGRVAAPTVLVGRR